MTDLFHNVKFVEESFDVKKTYSGLTNFFYKKQHRFNITNTSAVPVELKGIQVDRVWLDAGASILDKIWMSRVNDATNFNPVTKPEHYNLNPYGVEAIDAIKAATCDAKGEEAVFQANIIKYTWRYRRKNGLEDLKKARWYLDKLIGLYENGRYKASEQQ